MLCTCFKVNLHSTVAWMSVNVLLETSVISEVHNHLVCKRTLNQLFKLATWLSIHLKTKWLWVWILLLSLSQNYSISVEGVDLNSQLKYWYLLRNYLGSTLKILKLSSSPGAWSSSAVFSVLMIKVNIPVNPKGRDQIKPPWIAICGSN